MKLTSDQQFKIIASLSAILLAIASFISVEVWNMRPVVYESAHRIDRIAAAMPELGLRIAKEELRLPVHSAVVVTTRKTGSREYTSDIEVLDFDKGKSETFLVKSETRG